MNMARGRRTIQLTRAAALLLLVHCLQGCSSGDGTAAATPVIPSSNGQGTPSIRSASGELQFRVVFPTKSKAVSKSAGRKRGTGPIGFYDGSIPRGSHSVKIVVSDPTSGTALAPARIVADTTRPDGVVGGIIVGFPLLPVGKVKVDISAFPTLDATGNALAVGSDTATVVANQTSAIGIPLQLTLATLTLSPPTQTLHTISMPFPTGMVDGQALNAQGQPLLYPLEYSTDNPVLLPITSVSDDFMHATVMPQSFLEGIGVPVNVTVLEPNTGTTQTVEVIVAP